MTFDEIKHWVTYEGGICTDFDRSFGGDPAAQPKLNLRMQQRPGEIAACIKFLLDKKNNGEQFDYYAEIGACSGGTSYAMNYFLNFKELLIIDDGGAEVPDMYVNDRGDQLRGQILGFIKRIEIIGSSLEPRVIAHALNIGNIQKYDVLFIDGEHTYNAVRSDTLNYLPIIRPGGYVIFHDTAAATEQAGRWPAEIPFVLPELTLRASFSCKDEFTEHCPNGFGIKIFQKNY
jgi:hypothetical protein